MAGGVNSNAYGIAVHGNDVIVTGGFTTAGGWLANYLARWNTADMQWYSPGNTVNGSVYAVALSGSDVYVGGRFTSAGGLAANDVAQWNSVTNAWSALGLGLAHGADGQMVADGLQLVGFQAAQGV